MNSGGTSTASSSPGGGDNNNNNGLQLSSASESFHDEDVFKYKVNEKVFCYHGVHMYQARCLRTEIRENQPQYFIHYHGWNKNWDEWVTDERMLAYNEENMRKYELLRPRKRSKGGVKRVSGKQLSATAGVTNTIASSITTTATATNQSIITGTVQNVARLNAAEPQNHHASHTNANSNSMSQQYLRKTPTVQDRLSITTPNSDMSGSGDMKLDYSLLFKKRRKRGPKGSSDVSKFLMRNNDYNIPKLPQSLKQILANDFWMMEKERKILNLALNSDNNNKAIQPNQITVQTVLMDYLKDRKEKEDKMESKIEQPLVEVLINSDSDDDFVKYLGSNFRKCCFEEFVENLKRYFDTILATKVLYSIERVQYQDLFPADNSPTDNPDPGRKSNPPNSDHDTDEVQMPKIRSRKNSDSNNQIQASKTTANRSKSNLTPKDIYTSVHLLRMFTSPFNECIQYFNGDNNLFQILDILFNDFFEFLQENQEQYFGENSLTYTTVDDDYMQRYGEALFSNYNQSGGGGGSIKKEDRDSLNIGNMKQSTLSSQSTSSILDSTI